MDVLSDGPLSPAVVVGVARAISSGKSDSTLLLLAQGWHGEMENGIDPVRGNLCRDGAVCVNCDDCGDMVCGAVARP